MAERVGQLPVEKLQAGGKVRNPPPMYFRTHTKNCLSAAFLAERVGQLRMEKSHGGWQSAQPALQAHVFPNPYKKLPFGSFFGGEGGTIVPSGGSNP